jgi:hypothetical protein
VTGTAGNRVYFGDGRRKERTMQNESVSVVKTAFEEGRSKKRHAREAIRFERTGVLHRTLTFMSISLPTFLSA